MVDYDLDYLNKNNKLKKLIPKSDIKSSKKIHSNNQNAVRENYFDSELMKE